MQNVDTFLGYQIINMAWLFIIYPEHIGTYILICQRSSRQVNGISPHPFQNRMESNFLYRKPLGVHVPSYVLVISCITVSRIIRTCGENIAYFACVFFVNVQFP